MNVIEGTVYEFYRLIEVVRSSSTTEEVTETWIEKIVEGVNKSSQISYNIKDIIYILIAMIIVVAIFTFTLQVFKFFRDRRDPNYKKNDDTFLDD